MNAPEGEKRARWEGCLPPSRHFSSCVSVWISCVPVAEEDGDCYTGNGLAYRGTRSRTKSGASCLPWNSMFLTSKIYTAWKSNARALGLGKHNHCRWATWTPGACLCGGWGGPRRKLTHEGHMGGRDPLLRSDPYPKLRGAALTCSILRRPLYSILGVFSQLCWEVTTKCRR